MSENTVKPPKLGTLGEWKGVRFAENGWFTGGQKQNIV